MSYPSESTPDESVWRRLLIVCPLLVLADDATHAAAFALAACVVLVASSIGISAIRALVAQHIRIPAFALVSGLFATTAALLMQAFVFDLTERIALFAAIVVAISIDLAHVVQATSRAWGRVLVDTVAICVAFGVVLVALGAVREMAVATLPPAVTAPVAFVIAGLSIAAKNALRGKA
jgi:electron transport complex protein RnfE